MAAAIEEWSSYELDLTPASLRQLDQIVDEGLATDTESAAKVGAYAGAVFAKQYDGNWAFHDSTGWVVMFPAMGSGDGEPPMLAIQNVVHSCIPGKSTFAEVHDAFLEETGTDGPRISEETDEESGDDSLLEEVSDEEMATYREHATSLAEQWPEYDLDFTPESLERLDELVKAEYDYPDAETDEAFVSLEDTSSIEHAWAGAGKPLNADKLVLEGFRNKLEWETAGDIEISVIVNDEKMAAETSSPLYGGRIDDMPFSVSISGPLSVEELRSKLSEDVDFLHYIGHVETDGFKCTDGVLHLKEADVEVTPAAFFLNACQSYEQGIEMVRAGSMGGIVTVSDVINQNATHLGQLVAKLLNHGFSLRSALGIAKRENLVGNQYLVVGDGGTQIAQSVAGTPYVVAIESIRSDLFEVTIEGYPSVEKGMGALFYPLLEGVDRHYLNTGAMDSFLVGRGDLDEFISRQNTPLFYEGELHWSNEFSLY
jgi:hypothetical protein